MNHLRFNIQRIGGLFLCIAFSKVEFPPKKIQNKNKNNKNGNHRDRCRDRVDLRNCVCGVMYA